MLSYSLHMKREKMKEKHKQSRMLAHCHYHYNNLLENAIKTLISLRCSSELNSFSLDSACPDPE